MLLDDLADYLSTQGIGTVGTDIFKAMSPDTPDDVVVLYESGGFPAEHTMTTGPGQAVLERPTVQIVCRSARYDSAREVAHQVDQILNGARDTIINGITYRWIEAMQPPFHISRDARDRQEVGCNYRIQRDAATSS